MRDFHIACGQFEPDAGAMINNLQHMKSQAAEAAQAGAELILFPELAVTGYLAADRIAALSERTTGRSVQYLSDAAKRISIAIAFGFAEETADTMYNSLVVLAKSGELVGLYRKTHLWDTEKRWASAGETVATFPLAGVSMGGWICYDTRFPELARMAFLQGAEICLVPTAWLGPSDEWELALRSRALDNSFFVAGADTISRDPKLRCKGLSMIVGPSGNVLARAEEGTEQIIHAVLNKKELESQRRDVPIARDRRPGLYSAVASGSPDLSTK